MPGDGETHQGIYDAAFFSELDSFQIVSPCNYAELAYWLERLLLEDGPRALRYPRGAEDEALAALDCSGLEYDVFRAEGPADAALVTYGAQAKERWRPRNWPRSKAFAWMCTNLQ